MSEAVNKLELMRLVEREAKQWKQKVGTPYRGGGGGAGKIMPCQFSVEVYYQETDGAKNYHGLPDMLRRCVSEEIDSRITELIEAGERRLAEKKREAMEAAKAEYDKLISEMGDT